MPDWMTAFRDAFPPDAWSDNDEELDQYSLDSWPSAIKLVQAGCSQLQVLHTWPQLLFQLRQGPICLHNQPRH